MNQREGVLDVADTRQRGADRCGSDQSRCSSTLGGPAWMRADQLLYAGRKEAERLLRV